MRSWLLILILAVSSPVFAQWHLQTSGVNSSITSIYFANESSGWACGDNFILNTTNGGDVWNTTYINATLTSIDFIDENRGWVCGNSGAIYKTTDGGNSWNPQTSGVIYNLNSIQFLNASTGFAAGFGASLLKTTDGGSTWINIYPTPGFFTFYSLDIVDNNIVFASGDMGSVYRSTDLGLSWDSISTQMPNPFFTIYFLNENTGWTLGCCGMYFKTTDGGITWTPETYITPGFTIYGSSFIGQEKGWVAADGGYLLRTSNGGSTWDSLYSGTTNDLKTIHFVNDSTGWAAGYDGTILKTTNGGGQGWSVGISQLSVQIPEKYSLEQNYPNPFNPSTTITFSIPESAFTELKIYDVTGKEVSNLVNQRLQAGSYSYSFNSKGLNSGMYFYTLKTGDFIQTRKMVLIK